MTSVLDEILISLSPLRSLEVGSTAMLDFAVGPSGNPDAGEDAVVVRVTLTNPVGDTWDISDLYKAQHKVEAAVADTGIDAGDVVVQFVPQSPDNTDDE